MAHARRVALVTGGSTGIGEATAHAFAREGAKVVVGDVNVTEGEQTVNKIREIGGVAQFIHTDVSVPEEAALLIDKTVKDYGSIDCAFNNAGIIGTPPSPTHEYPDEQWKRVIDINLNGVWYCMKYEIREMLTQGHGAIVNTSSIWGVVGAKGFSAYVASKHAVAGLTKTAALEYAKSGIRINAVNPGPTDTAIPRSSINLVPEAEEQIKADVPMARMGKPSEIAEAVIWLCSDAASFVIGHTLLVDGGYVAK